MQLPEESSDIFFLRGRSVIYKRWGKRAITSFFAFPIFWGEQSFTRWEGYDFSMTQKPANDISLFFTFGYAATFAWASAVFFHNLLFTDISLAVTCSAFYIAGMAISVVSLAAMGSLDALVRRSMGSRVALCVIAALTCIGTFCTAHAAIETEYGPVALFAGIIFTGLGSGYLIALWGWFIGNKVEKAASNLCMAYALAAVLFFLLAVAPHPVTVAAASLLPAVSVALFAVGTSPRRGLAVSEEEILATARRRAATLVEAKASRTGTLTASATSQPAAAGTTTPKVSLAKAFKKLSEKQVDDAASANSGQAAPAKPEQGVRASLSNLASQPQGNTYVEFLLRSAVAAVLFGIVVGLMNYTSQGGASAGDNMTFAFMFLGATEVPVLLLFAYFQFHSGDSVPKQRFAHMYLAAILVLFVSLLLANATQTHQELFAVIGLAGYVCLKIAFWTLFASIVYASGVSAVTVFCIGEGCQAAGLFAGSLLSGVIPTASGYALVDSIAIGVLILTYIFVLNDRKVYAILYEPAPAVIDERARFQARCEEIATQYSLSKRETEVFLLMARGHSAARMAEDLYVSTGTVNSHVKSIYRKMGIHSKQELLNIVEGQ